MFGVLHPTATTAYKNSIEAYLKDVKSLPMLADDLADVVFKALWRKEVGRLISEQGFGLIDGSITDISQIQTLLSKVDGDFLPKDFDEQVDTDPLKLFESLNSTGRWVLNIPVLSQYIRHVGGGQLIVIAARPESGKTACLVNLMAGKQGFAAQGAKVVYIGNEESAASTAGRAVCCFMELPFQQLRINPELADTPEWHEVRKKLTFLHKPEITMHQLDNYCKRQRPDVIILDQLDNFSISGEYNSDHERIGAVYRKAREIGSKYDCTVIAATQASAEAEGQTKITFSMAANSKTDKAAAADIFIGIGRQDEQSTMEEPNEVLRYYNVSKNKTGWKGMVCVKLIQDQSRLIP